MKSSVHISLWVTLAIIVLLFLSSTAGAYSSQTWSTYLPIIHSINSQTAIVADHTHTNRSAIPGAWVTAAKEKVVWIYGHTSHGSQLVSGAQYLNQYVNPPTYKLLANSPIPPIQANPIGLRLGDDGGWSWNENGFLQTARNRINAVITAGAIPTGSVGVFMWSWCGEMSWLSTASVQHYLDMMNQLQGEFPAIRFVYMTGHTDGTSGPSSTLMNNNQMVRNDVQANKKLLFDFADIESWLPDGTPYAGVPTDACPWCQNWCDTHPGYCPAPAISCAHSHSLNCYLKGQAFWWLSARIAGWDGITK